MITLAQCRKIDGRKAAGRDRRPPTNGNSIFSSRSLCAEVPLVLLSGVRISREASFEFSAALNCSD